MMVVMKVNAALRREIARGRLPASLQATKRLMSLELRSIPRTTDAFEAFPVAVRPQWETLTRLYWEVPPRHRERLPDLLRSLVRLSDRATRRRKPPPRHPRRRRG
jgi:hypothetical protein